MRLEKIVGLAIGGMSLFHPISSGANEVVSGKVEFRKMYSPGEIKRIVEETALNHGVDPHLASAVAYNESRYQPHVVSHMGAIGPMQLMPEVAEELGVNPYDPIDNIKGGVELLKQHENRYDRGDNTMDREELYRTMAAAYHAGFPTVDIKKEKYGENGWFGKLKRSTRSYVNEVLGTYRDSIGVNQEKVISGAYFPIDYSFVE